MTLSAFPVYPISISLRKASYTIALIDKALAHHVVDDGVVRKRLHGNCSFAHPGSRIATLPPTLGSFRAIE